MVASVIADIGRDSTRERGRSLTVTSPDDWLGALPSERGRPTVSLVAPIGPPSGSGANAAKGLADDGNVYWFKLPDNEQGVRVLANEVIVGALGSRLGAPVRQCVLASVAPGLLLRPDGSRGPARGPSSVAHASLHLESALEDDDLTYTRRDDNSRRQVWIMALWDLCLGQDPQWLYDSSEDYTIWSYDHGLWFWSGEGDWDPAMLRRSVLEDSTYAPRPHGLDRSTVAEVAEALADLTRNDLLKVVSAVPIEWGIPDVDLEHLAWFLYERREMVADRLVRTLSATRA